MAEKKVSKKEQELMDEVATLTADLQRMRADFENYRKRSEADKTAARDAGQSAMVLKLLPVIDNIDRAVGYAPEDLKDNDWVKGVTGLPKQLGKSLEGMNLVRIEAKPGTLFDPELHEAIQFDEETEGEQEVVSEELQAGYSFNGRVIRHAMVKVSRQ